MESFKELQAKINLLQDGFDIKSLELGLLESEMQDTLKPTALLNEQNKYLLEILEQIIKFEKSKPSASVTASKNRLVTLLGINTQLSQIMYYNQSLKLFNRELVTSIQLLRLENSELKKQLKNISDANNF